MSLFDLYEELNRIFPKNKKLFQMAKIDLLVDGRLTAPIPSYFLEQDYLDCITLIRAKKNPNWEWLDSSRTKLLHSLFYWAELGEAYFFSNEISNFIMDLAPCQHLIVSELYKIPKNGIYVEQCFDDYEGFLVGWDYEINTIGEQVDFLNFTFLAKDFNKIKFIRFELPKKYKIYDIAVHKKEIYWHLLEKAIGILLFVINELDHRTDIEKGNRKYFELGRRYASKIKLEKERSLRSVGHWRKAHTHLYWVNRNGVKVAIYKWIEPVWVSA